MQEKRWQWSIGLLLSLASRLRGRHGCFGFVCWSVGRLVGRLIGRSVGGGLAARSLARLLEGGLSSSIEDMFLQRN